MKQEPRYNKERHSYGTRWEGKLQPLLEIFCEEPLTKTAHRYDIMDFVSDHHVVELKSRSMNYHPENFKTWLLPTCKAKEATKIKDKKVLYFYWWPLTKELYVLEYDEKLFQSFYKEVPEWHLDQQEHYYVPASEFSLVQFIEC